MTGRDRGIIARRRAPLLAVACLAMPLVLAGCTGFRQVIGLDQAGPDEFAVESRAPLTIPPEFNLRPPQPGAPRPQEATAAERAQKVINAAGPGKLGDQANSGLKMSAAEIGGGGPDASREVADRSLASKLLGASDTASGGGVVKRETAPLKGVY